MREKVRRGAVVMEKVWGIERIRFKGIGERGCGCLMRWFGL